MGPIVPSLLQLSSLFRINFTHQYTTCFPKTEEVSQKKKKQRKRNQDQKKSTRLKTNILNGIRELKQDAPSREESAAGSRITGAKPATGLENFHPPTPIQPPSTFCWSLSQRLASDSPLPPLPQICATALPPAILIRAADRGEAAAAWCLASKARAFFGGICWDFSRPVKDSWRLPVGLVIRPSLEVVGSLQFLPARILEVLRKGPNFVWMKTMGFSAISESPLAQNHA
jgi:hypothetical protein